MWEALHERSAGLRTRTRATAARTCPAAAPIAASDESLDRRRSRRVGERIESPLAADAQRGDARVRAGRLRRHRARHGRGRRWPPADAVSFLWPLLADSAERVERRERPLCHSHMFDGSTLPLEENLRVSAALLDRCRELDIVLEVECGVVGGEEDGIGGGDVSRDRLYTTPEDLVRVAEALGTGERGRYLLAATFGNVHGVYAPGQVQLRPEILADGQEALERAHAGARFQYVFHGSSGSSPEELRAAVDNGVVKVNLDTESQYAFTRAAAEHMIDNRDGVLAPEPASGDKRAYDPRAWGAKAEIAMAERVAQACEQLGSAGRSIAA